MATDRIRGITIDIGGDTTKLTEALKGVNATLRSTQSALKDIDKLLKLDPTNTNLLYQKQVQLEEAIDATRSKLEREKEALRQIADSNQTGVITEEQRALEREIIETEQKLKGLEDEMKSFGSVGKQQVQAVADKIGQIGTKVKAVGETLSSMGKTLTTSVTAPLVAAGAIATKSFAEVDKTMQLTNKTMGNTAEQAELLNDAMKDAAASSTFGMAEAAEATLNFARAGLTAEEAAAALAPSMKLAAGEGGELATVSAGLVATINGFGDSFERAQEYADIFAAACNNSALEIDQMVSSMSIAAPVFKAAGYSVKDASLYMGVMANSGIDANTAATALKTGLARLAKPSKEASDAIKALGISIFDTDGNMKDSVTVQRELNKAFSQLTAQEQLAAAASIFGKNQMSNWLALINTAPEEVLTLSAALSDCAGTTEEMSEAMMSGFGGSLEKLKSSLDVLATSFGELIGKALLPTIEKIQGMVDYLNSLDDATKTTIVQVAAVAAAIGPLLVVIGKLIESVGTIMTVVPKLSSALLAMPPQVAAVVAVLALMAAAYVGLEKAMNDMDAENAKLANGMRYLNDEQKKLVEGAQGVIDTSKKSAEARKADRDAMDGQKALVSKLTNELRSYTTENGKVVKENERVKEIVAELNTIMPELNLAYDEQAGAISLTADEVERYTDALLKQAEAAAIQEHLTEIMKERIEIEAQMVQMEDMVAEAEQKATDAAVAFHEAQNNIKDVSELTCYEIQAQTENLEMLRQAQMDAANECSAATGPYYEMQARLEELGNEQDYLTDKIGETSTAMGEGANAALDAAAGYDEASGQISSSWEELYESASKSISGQINLFEEYTAAQSHTKEEVLKNMQEHVAAVQEWSDNIAELARKGISEGLLQELLKMGPEGAGYVAAFNEMTSAELSEASRLFDEATMLPSETITKVQDNYEQVGQYAAEGLQDGIKDNKSKAQDAAKEMAQDVLHDTKAILRIQSPSVEFENIGKYIGLGMQGGIKQKTPDAVNAARQMAQSIKDTVATVITATEFQAIGQRIGEGLAAGMMAMIPAVQAAAQQLAAAAAAATRAKLGIHSPSKVFEEMGDLSGEGYAKGLAESLSSLDTLLNQFLPNGGQAVTNQTITNSMPINVSIVGGEGQNAAEIAQEAAQQISDEVTRMRAAWGY